MSAKRKDDGDDFAIWMAKFMARHLVVKPFKFLKLRLLGSASAERPWIARQMFDGDTNHIWVQGGSGHGKTSLLKEQIADNVKLALAGKMSVFVMDSSELIDELLATARFTKEQLARVVLIDLANPGGPNDPGSMPRLNILETPSRSGDEFLRIDAKINTFKTIFEGVLDNSATPAMEDMLSYAAQTLAYVTDPTLDTLLNLIRDPIPFIADIKRLPRDVRNWWHDEIKMKPVKDGGAVVDYEMEMSETQKGLLRRIGALKRSTIIKRLLINDVPTVDLAEKLNEGAIILVATRKGDVMAEGTRMVMRFMLSMLHRAAEQRHSLGSLMPTAVYIDEFQDALKSKDDESIKLILSQIRKRGFSVVLANQEKGQLSPDMRSALKANCAIRVAGGINPDDEEDMRKLLGVRKERGEDGLLGWSIDLGTLKKGEFVVYKKGGKPRVIETRRDAFGEAFTPLPAKKRERMSLIIKELQRVRRYMKRTYAHDPSATTERPEETADIPGVTRPAYV